MRHLPSFLQSVFNLPVASIFTKTVEEGTATTIRAVMMSDSEFARFGGSYFSDCNAEYNRWDMNDPELQNMMWNLTERLISDRTAGFHFTE